ncbi:hypothetical protein L9F63_007636, partial [Diploptera punctata]
LATVLCFLVTLISTLEFYKSVYRVSQFCDPYINILLTVRKSILGLWKPLGIT